MARLCFDFERLWGFVGKWWCRWDGSAAFLGVMGLERVLCIDGESPGLGSLSRLWGDFDIVVSVGFSGFEDCFLRL